MNNITVEVIQDLKHVDKLDLQRIEATKAADEVWSKINHKVESIPDYAYAFNFLRCHEMDELEDIFKKDRKGIVTVANFALAAAIFGYLKHEGVLDELQKEGSRVFKKLVKEAKSHAK